VNVHHLQGLRMMDIHSDLSSNADMNRYDWGKNKICGL
jgi:hypothetical protein